MSNFRVSGVDVVDNIPWGTHFCQFYQLKEDLMDIIIPYFRVDLKNNEFCLWITSESLNVEEAKEALRKTISDFDIYLEKGQIEIIPYSDWYLKDGFFDSDRTLNRWVHKLNQTLANGYEGLRAVESTSWLEDDIWDDFIDYEKKLSSVTAKYPIIVLCTYSLDMYSSVDTIEIAANHQFSLVKKKGKWNRIENPRCKRAEEAASQAAKDWEQIFDAMPDLIAVIDNECRVVRANKAMAARLGITPEDCIGVSCHHVVHGTDKPPSFCPNQQLLRDGLEHSVEMQEDRLGGTFLLSVSPLFNHEGEIIGSVQVARDITERKQAEKALYQAHEKLQAQSEELQESNEALKENEEKYRALFENSIDAILLTLPDGTIYAANPAACQIFRMTEEEIIRVGRGGIIDTSDPRLKSALEERTITGRFKGELNYRRKDGTIFPGETSSTIFKDKKGIVKAVVIIRNVTERKQMEKELQESEEKYRNIIETASEGIWIGDSQAKTIYVNKRMAEMAGYTQDEMIGKYAWDFTDEEGKPIVKYNIEKGRQGIDERYEFKFLRKDGSPLWTIVSSKSFFDDSGKFTGSMSMLTDITERKEVEAKLKETLDNLEELVKQRTNQLEEAYKSLEESERSLAEAQEMAHIGSWERNLAVNKLHWSDELYRIFGLEPQEFEMTYDMFLNYVHPDDRNYVDNAVKGAFNGKPFDIDYKIILPNGKERIVHSKGEVVFDDKNNPVRVRGTAQDITDRKLTEEALAKIEETRIKEIHHRIKNNLQIISSLLSLQSEKFNDVDVLEAFKDSQNRVASMALIHEELFQGKGTYNLDFAAYLQKLTQELFSSHNLRSEDINLKLDLEQAYLGMDTAIPLGIIVNELVSNSLKHAFPDGKKWEISISLKNMKNLDINKEVSNNECNHEDFQYTLTVADNGGGIPEEVDLQTINSLGLQLVNILVDQIDGCIELRRDNGTEFVIWFSDVEK